MSMYVHIRSVYVCIIVFSFHFAGVNCFQVLP